MSELREAVLDAIERNLYNYTDPESTREAVDIIIALCMDAAVEAVKSSQDNFFFDVFGDTELIATGDAENAIKALKERNDA